jgi:molybdopterin-synthase adenylyltransferase
MPYAIVIPPVMAEALRAHLLTDRSREQMAIVLCGVDQTHDRVRLLGRHLVTMPPEAFTHQSSGGLALDQAVQRHVLALASREGLSQVDFHTHPGDGPGVAFSTTDDGSEREMVRYLASRLPGTLYASVVLNACSAAARIWQMEHGEPNPVPVEAPRLDAGVAPARRRDWVAYPSADGRFDRQLMAFGPAFQETLRAVRIGVVGLGGLGSVMVEELARLGVRDWVLVDPDRVEPSNLNRLVHATPDDADEEIPKVDVAARNIRSLDKEARVEALQCTAFAPRSLKRLKECDLLIATTDNDASRLALNALSCQYLIPLVHAGVNLEPGEHGVFHDISGEVALPPLGGWCLLCAGVVSPQRAAWDLARPEERALLAARGYISGVAAPAVYHLNALIASLAVTEIHNLLHPYKPLRRYLVYRELVAELMSIEVSQTDGCLHCGPEGLLGLGDLALISRPHPARSLLAAGIPAAGRDPAAVGE